MEEDLNSRDLFQPQQKAQQQQQPHLHGDGSAGAADGAKLKHKTHKIFQTCVFCIKIFCVIMCWRRPVLIRPSTRPAWNEPPKSRRSTASVITSLLLSGPEPREAAQHTRKSHHHGDALTSWTPTYRTARRHVLNFLSMQTQSQLSCWSTGAVGVCAEAQSRSKVLFFLNQEGPKAKGPTLNITPAW